MERRSYLGALTAAGFGGVAGCLDTLSGGDGSGDDDSETVLGPPDRDRGDPSHPIHGEEFPAFSIPDPLAEEDVSLDELTGDRPFLMTFIYTSCPDGCGQLGRTLGLVQSDAAERGYGDDVSFLAMTFDPETDDSEALQEYANRHEIDLESGNWHFLRPETQEEALALVNEEPPDGFGAPVVVEPPEDHDHENGHDDHDHEHDVDAETTTHFLMIFLVNERGIVERSYPNATSYTPQEIIEDTRTVVE